MCEGRHMLVCRATDALSIVRMFDKAEECQERYLSPR